METQKFLIELQYEGTNYCGWQRQKTGITVQEELENALKQMCNQRIVAHGCSRTDAKVHAKGQLVFFSLPLVLANRWNLYRLVTSLNRLTPKDIVITKITKVDSSFSFAVNRGKRYLYTIHNSPVPPLEERNRSWWIPKPLPIDRLQELALHFIGQHNFAAFCPTQGQKQNPIKTISVCKWHGSSIVHGYKLILQIEGDSFLQYMIRIIVGTMYDMVQGKLAWNQIEQAILSQDRKQVGITAPGEGLLLDRIFMPEPIEKALAQPFTSVTD